MLRQYRHAVKSGEQSWWSQFERGPVFPKSWGPGATQAFCTPRAFVSMHSAGPGHNNVLRATCAVLECTPDVSWGACWRALGSPGIASAPHPSLLRQQCFDYVLTRPDQGSARNRHWYGTYRQVGAKSRRYYVCLYSLFGLLSLYGRLQ